MSQSKSALDSHNSYFDFNKSKFHLTFSNFEYQKYIYILVVNLIIDGKYKGRRGKSTI